MTTRSDLPFGLQMAALYGIAVWVPLQYVPTRQFELLPRSAVWIDDGLLALLAVAALLAAWRRPARARAAFGVPLAAFATVAVASAVVNRANLTELVLGLRAPLQAVVLAYVLLVLRVPAVHLVRLGLITVVLAVLQAPVAVAQMVATHELISRDEIFGTLWRGASNSLAYFLLMVGLPLAGYWLRRPEKRWPLAAIAALMVPFVFCSSRGAYYLAPIVVLVVFGGRLRDERRVRRLLAGTALLAAVLFAVFYGVKPRSPGIDPELSPRRIWREQLDPDGAMGRLHYLGTTVDLLRERGLGAILVGVGPARFSSTSGAYLGAPLLLVATRGAHAPVIPSQLIATLAEFGVLGLVALSLAVVQGIRVLRAAGSRLRDPGWRGWAEGAVGAGLFFLLAAPLENVWELQHVAYYFWAMVGVAALQLRRESA